MANRLCEKFEVTIFTIYAKGELEKQLNSKVQVKNLYPISYGELSKLNKEIIVPLKVLLCKKGIYHKYIQGEYDVEIAFLEGPITRLFSVPNSKTRKIVWIHNDMTLVFGKGLKSKLKRRIDKKIYSQYAELIFVSQDNLKRFNSIYQGAEIEQKKKRIITNYLDAKRVIEKAEEEIQVNFEKDAIHFLTVARLVEQKGIDRIIKVHSELIKEGLHHHFYVIGEGPQQETLEQLISKEKVEKTFHLLGKKENPYPFMKKADYFCLLSRFEGYGMVLEEAKILEKNILITDTAAREAVENYQAKIITPNSEEGIKKAMKKILINDKIHKQEKKKTKYCNEPIIQNIIDLLENKLDGRNKKI